MFGKVLGAYLKNLKLTVIPMAFTYLGAIILIIFAWRGAASLIGILTAGLSAAAGIAAKGFSMNAAELSAAFREIHSLSGIGTFVNEGVGSFVEKLGITAAETLEKIGNTVTEALESFFIRIGSGFLVFFLLFVVGFVLCSIAVRKSSGARVSGKTVLLNTIFKVILLSIAIGGLGYASSLKSGWALLAAVVLVLLEIFLKLLGAFLSQYKFKEIRHVFRLVNPKTMLAFTALTILLTCLAFGLGYLIFLLLKDTLIALILVAPLIVYVLCFLDALAEIYVRKGENKIPVQP